MMFLSSSIWSATEPLKFYADLSNYAHPLYPISYHNNRTQQWQSGWRFTENQQNQLYNLANYSNITNARLPNNQSVYKPELDQTGPYWFLPPHCYEPSNLTDRFALPVIGYIDRNNSLQQDMIDQLALMIEDQAQILPLAVNLYNSSLASSLDLYPDNFTEIGRQYGFNVTSGQWNQSNLLSNLTFKPFKSHKEFDKYISQKGYGSDEHPGVCFGFDVHEHSNNHYDLELMFQEWDPSYLKGIDGQEIDPFDLTRSSPQTNHYKYYSLHGFSYLQNWFASTLLQRKTGVQDASITVLTVPMGSNPILFDKTRKMMESIFLYYMLLFYCPIYFRVTYRVLVEKSSRVKEMMRMMGMTDLAYWISWWLYFNLVNLIIVVALAPFLICFAFPKSEPLIVIGWVFTFGQTLPPFILTLQTFFHAPKTGAIWMSILYFSTGLLTMILSQDYVRRSVKLAIGLFLPPLAMTLGCETLVKQEYAMGGINFITWKLEHFNYSVFDSITSMVVSQILYSAVGLYLDRVLPSPFGERKSIFFCLQACCKPCRKASYTQSNKSNHKHDTTYASPDANFETHFLSKENYEPVPPEIQSLEQEDLLLRIENLQKTYPNGFAAVQGINLKMYADQIFVLLGQNGAGKSTTIGMLAGLFNPSEGQAEVLGVDLFGARFEARKFMGICPQYDILFELLTPEEHIRFFQSFKGAENDSSSLLEESEALLTDIGLVDKRNCMSYQLSGGNKRKLSTLLALCGESKFVIFDEPTAGMDLTARRHFWNMLRKYRKGRIILLTTHYMDEADVLGDRVGIMARGRMTCLGSSPFLKRKFGVGYNLTAVKFSTEPNDKLMLYLCKHLGPNCRCQSEIQNEMTVRVPAVYAPKFSRFFDELDRNKENLGILSYGISQTTLEEVFMNVGHLQDPTSKNSSAQHSNDPQVHQADDTPIGGVAGIQHSSFGQSEDGQNYDFSQIQLDDSQNSISSDDDFAPDNSVGLNSPEADNQLLRGQVQTYTVPPGHSQFNLRKNNRELDTTLARNLGAQFYRRFCTYRNSPISILLEFVTPSVFFALGLCMKLGQVKYTRSASRTFDAALVPEGTPFLVGPHALSNGTSDVEAADFFSAENFPLHDRFLFKNVSDWAAANSSFDSFANQTNDFGNFSHHLPPYFYSSYGIYESSRARQQYSLINWLNLTSMAATVLFPQLMYESILRVATNDSAFRFSVTNTPYPLLYEKLKPTVELDINIAVFAMGLAYAVVLLQIVGHLVSERSSGLQHLQVVSGLQLPAFWISQFVFDYFKCTLLLGTALFCFRFMPGFGYHQYFGVALVWPLSALPFTYAFSSAFKSVGNAQIFTLGISFFSFSILSITVYAQRAWIDSQQTGDRQMWLQRFMNPYFSLGWALTMEGMIDILKSAREQEIDGETGNGDPIDGNLWSMQNFYGDIVAIVLSCLFWTGILIVVETKACQKRRAKSDESSGKSANGIQQNSRKKKVPDEDVIEEAQRVQKGCRSDVLVSGFSKDYRVGQEICGGGRNLRAVNDLHFALSCGETFALLGVNGAGKTTTFKALTYDVIPTRGQIRIGPFDLHANFQEARKLIGYCPQYNLIWTTMNVEQHVRYFARIKGIPTRLIEPICADVITRLGLNEHRTKLAGTLSGGNQRKLCVAIAILGNPPVILLDEPSAGMDPGARRFMWQVIGDITSARTSAVVLTTHSMEEAEALCSKLAIMVKGGVFKCFGSAQHIKSKYGTGYLLDLKIRKPTHSELESIEMAFYSDSGFNTILDLESAFKNDEISEELQKELALVQREIEARDDRLCYLHAQANLYRIIRQLCTVFGEVQLIEQFSNFAKVRIPRLDKSIGFIFGLIERLQGKFDLEEYAVSQTTLEQIFQSFADEDFNENLRLFRITDNKLQVISA